MSRAYLTFNPEFENFSSLNVNGITEEIGTVDVEADPMQLQSKWKIWEQLETDQKDFEYKENMKAISSFETVQEFWQMWNMLPQPSQLMNDKRMVRNGPGGSSHNVDAIMIFRDDVEPMWEHPLNKHGGHFESRYTQTSSVDEQARMDEHWNNLVLGMVGATIDPSRMITGVRLVDKLHTGRGGNFIRIEVWFTETASFDELSSLLKSNIEKAMSTKLDGSRDNQRINLQFKSHLGK